MIGIGGDNLMQLSQISDDELVDIFTEIGMIGRDSRFYTFDVWVSQHFNPDQKTNLHMFYASNVH